MIYNTPQEAISIEKAVLGCMLLDADAFAYAVDILKKTDFYHLQHGELFEVMAMLYTKQVEIDIFIVADYLKDLSPKNPMYSDIELNGLTHCVGSVANIKDYCQIIVEKSYKRKIVLHCKKIEKKGLDPTCNPYDILDAMDSFTFSLIDREHGCSNYNEIRYIIKKIVKEIKNSTPGILSGLDIDKTTGGWGGGELIVIGARPSIDKTALALNFTLNAAIKQQKAVMFFSIEMAFKQIVVRLLSIISKVENNKIKKTI